ncbi:hypothetical protein JOD63_000291 [Microbacterium terrae]|uniref:Uncharacterized protein n=1 Tax=Microbacterium terrae TaxID=69369 RepID=A0A0M2H220_9MICO|nr:hypothetical protein [Microbacterium terrae]KJL37494.1 hypothetical protein RS81_03251 [Microbacterium terrae]MBP1076323.1 hypothetical protein [Microbacterium terrae]GLJ97147.1 hypothetical protein GCM10017594_03440 [Microbacterium terrae]
MTSVDDAGASSASPTDAALEQRAAAAAALGAAREPQYDQPVIDSETDVIEPVLLRRVEGHFEGTDVRFVISLPPREAWEGRFFQYLYPLQTEEALAPDIAFGASSGGYTVQATGRSGIRHEAAAAEFSRRVAADYYGVEPQSIAGYIYGGSGGSMQVIGAMEGAAGVWQGAVPFVMALPVSVPNNILAGVFGGLVFGDRLEALRDAVRPGADRAPEAVLEAWQSEVFDELTAFGIPPRSWEGFEPMSGLGLFHALGGAVKAIDADHVVDFWTTPGYLGVEDSPLGDLFRRLRVHVRVQVADVVRDESGAVAAVMLEDIPSRLGATAFDLSLIAGDEVDSTLLVGGMLRGDRVVLPVPVDGARWPQGPLQVEIDNSWFLALSAYYRYQVPSDPTYLGWTAYRDDLGEPQGPQRPIEVGPMFAAGTTGGAEYSGAFAGKIILVQNLVDGGALPWHAEWYRRRAEQSGRADDLRIWFTDNAEHLNGPRVEAELKRIVHYDPMYYQALRDVVDWVERGIEPPETSSYIYADGQVTLPDTAADRLGIQPYVALSASGRSLAVGDSVVLSTVAAVAPGGGEIVRAQWNVDGSSEWLDAPGFAQSAATRFDLEWTFDAPGTYFPVVRIASHRTGDANDPFGAIPNLARVRIDVTDRER